MSTRRARAAANRREHHLRRLERATTDRGALWAACGWLVAEAIRAGRVAEATRAVLDLARAVTHSDTNTPTTAVTVREVRDPLHPSPTSAAGVVVPAQRAGVGARGRAPARE